MKKLISASLVAAAAVLAPVAAHAQATAIVSNGLIEAPDCVLLAEDVRIPMSTSVLGAWACTPASNSIQVVGCHQAGRVGSRTIEVPCQQAPVDPNNPAPLCEGTANVNRVTNTGSAFMYGQTAGGQVGPLDLNGSLCDQASVDARL